MNIPVDYNDEAKRLRTHPDLLPKEEDTIRYVLPSPVQKNMNRSNAKRRSTSAGKDHRSVFSDKAIAKVKRRGSALHEKSKSGSEAGPKRGIIKRGREWKYSPRRKASPRLGHA